MADVPTTDLPDPDHRTPAGVDDATVEALGKLSEALETCERARGHLYSFHQLTGSADIELGDAVTSLREAGHAELADRLESELIGRNVLAGRWTFQIVEEYDDTYWSRFRELEKQARDELAGRPPPPVRGTAQAGRAHGRSVPPRGHAGRRPRLSPSRQTLVGPDRSRIDDRGDQVDQPPVGSTDEQAGRRSSRDTGHQVGDLHPRVVPGVDPTQIEDDDPGCARSSRSGDVHDPPRRQHRLLVVHHDEIAVLRSPAEHAAGQRRQQRLEQGWPAGVDLQRPSHRPRPSRAGAQPEQSLPHRSGRRRRGELPELTLEVGDGGRRHPPAGGSQRLAGRDQEGLPALQSEDGVALAIQLERHLPIGRRPRPAGPAR